MRDLPENGVSSAAERLDSWKDIAAYLRRDMTTVQRWEKREGLPIHRHLHDKQGSVYAYKSELDAWWTQGRIALDNAEATDQKRATEPHTEEGHRIWSAAVVGISFVAAVVAGVWWTTRVDQPLATVRSLVPLPPDAVSAFGIAVSPDGSRLAYIGLHHSSRDSRLYLKATNELDSMSVPGTEGARQPFFSPDGTWIGFFAAGHLKKVAVSGGAPVTLCAAPNPRGASWGPDDTIVFAPHYMGGLVRVPASGGDPVPVTKPDRAALERSHRYPRFLPDGRSVVFTAQRASQDSLDDSEIQVVRLDAGERTTILTGGTFPTYSASGHLLYGRHNTIFALRFDTTRLKALGTPLAVVKGVLSEPAMGRVAFGLSETGTLVYAAGGSPTLRQLLWVDRSGKTEAVLSERRPFTMARVSPNGRYVVAVADTGVSRLWLVDVARRTMTRLSGDWDAELPFWAPDNARIGYMGYRFAADGEGRPALFTMTPGSTAPAQPLAEEFGVGYDWSQDGSFVAVESATSQTRTDISLISVNGARSAKPLITSPGNDFGARFSRNGRWLAYVSNESGRNEVYVSEIAPPLRRWPVSTDGGTAPVWSHDSRELFYRNGRRVMSVKVSSAADFTAAPPEQLFVGPEGLLGALAFDVSPSGRFLMIAEASELSQPSALVLVQNWHQELQRLAPVR